MQASLFSPLRIGEIVLKNRFVMAPMGVCLASETGSVTPQLIDFYRERARGGVALILVGGGQVSDRRPPGLLNLDDDSMIPNLNDLAEAVQQEGARIGIQLNFSDHFLPDHLKRTPDNLTVEEIENIIQSFVKAASRVQEAGFDLVEFHGAHGYLISQFFSPLSNHRQDRYGGDIQKRRAFALEILQRARSKVGSRFPILFRINGSDFQEGGTEIEAAVQNARALEKAGVDGLDVSGGRRPLTDQYTMQPMGRPRGTLVAFAAAIKKETKVPVLAVGKIDASLASKIIEEGQADLVSMGRALIADPELPRKLEEGGGTKIRSCIYCNYCITQRTRLKKRIRCSVNASAGRERDFRIEEAKKKKRVLIIGGGPAGMECARVLKMRGHEVSLKEKEGHLGGQAWIACIPAPKTEIRPFLDFLEEDLRRLGVQIELGHTVLSQDIDRMKSDAIVLAVGALPLIPNIPGIQGEKIKTSFEVLKKEGEGLGERIVVIGGGEIGCEVAEYLEEKRKKVTIIEQMEEISLSLEPYSRRFFMERISRTTIEIRTRQKMTKIQGNRVYLVDPEGKTSSLEFDHAVLCMGTVANQTFTGALSGSNVENYSIGDCVNPKNIYQAISEGARIGRKI
jgi:2,4-dienoyl-CoA reductase-like NADH-dependent reductase (Old Yellow Enzyme family)/thioredoxin reductase